MNLATDSFVPSLAPVSAATVLVAVDTGSPDLASAEQAVHELEAVLRPNIADLVVSTHLIAGSGAHVAIGAELPDTDLTTAFMRLRNAFPAAGVVARQAVSTITTGPQELTTQAEMVLERHARRASGRLVRYPGQALIEGQLTVAEALASSCLDEVVAVGGLSVGPSSMLDLTGFSRPTWRDRRCILVVQPSVHGLIPFEVRDQIPCCSAH